MNAINWKALKIYLYLNKDIYLCIYIVMMWIALQLELDLPFWLPVNFFKVCELGFVSVDIYFGAQS